MTRPGPDLGPTVVRGLQEQAARRAHELSGGGHRVGWKIALNDPRVQQALGIGAPVIGYLTSGTVVPPGGEHSLAGATRPAIEPEVAVHVGEGGSVAGLGAALEVIDVDMPFEDLGAILAGNVFHRAAVLGPVAPGTTSVDGRRARLTRTAGDEVDIDVAAAALAPLEVVHLVGGYLEAIGEELRSGDVIIAGSLVRALPLAADERVELEIDGLEPVAVEVRSA